MVAPAFASKNVKRMTKLAMEFTEMWICEALGSSTAEDGIVDVKVDDSQDTHSSSFDVAEDMLGIILSAFSETVLEYKMSAEEKA